MQSTPTLMPDMVLKALRAWDEVGGTAESLLASLLLIQQRRQSVAKAEPSVYRMLTSGLLLEGIKALERKNPEGAKILRQRFIEKKSVQMVALAIGLSSDQTKKRQRQAVETLTQIIWEQETAARAHAAAEIESRLPLLQTELFGIEKGRQLLIDRLRNEEGNWIVGIIGIGGIGKTALADSVVRSVIHKLYFKDVVWLNVEHNAGGSLEPLTHFLSNHLFGALFPNRQPQNQSATTAEIRYALKQHPYLIVIDNLEERAAVEAVIDYFQPLANPSKLLFTSRLHPNLQTDIFAVTLDELDVTAAGALLRHHASRVGVVELSQLGEGEVAQVYEVVGGNPLALKLVVGLARSFSLPTILEDLAQARIRAVRDMYLEIYAKIWQTLSPTAQEVLEAMPTAGSSGMALDQLVACTQLTTHHLLPAISELTACSLMEVGGSSNARLYRIHRLTESFLATEVIGWPDDMSELAS